MQVIPSNQRNQSGSRHVRYAVFSFCKEVPSGGDI